MIEIIKREKGGEGKQSEDSREGEVGAGASKRRNMRRMIVSVIESSSSGEGDHKAMYRTVQYHIKRRIAQEIRVVK